VNIADLKRAVNDARDRAVDLSEQFEENGIAGDVWDSVPLWETCCTFLMLIFTSMTMELKVCSSIALTAVKNRLTIPLQINGWSYGKMVGMS